MNPLTNVKNLKKLTERELELGIDVSKSWHQMYKDSAWIFIGGLSYELSEGDVICVFSQYGEVNNIYMPRDKATGKTKGFCFLCYEDQRSTILAVDNLNGIKLVGRIIRVDHVQDFKPPKDYKQMSDETRKALTEGVAPQAVKIELSSSDSEDDITRPSGVKRPEVDLSRVKVEGHKIKKEIKKEKESPIRESGKHLKKQSRHGREKSNSPSPHHRDIKKRPEKEKEKAGRNDVDSKKVDKERREHSSSKHGSRSDHKYRSRSRSPPTKSHERVRGHRDERGRNKKFRSRSRSRSQSKSRSRSQSRDRESRRHTELNRPHRDHRSSRDHGERSIKDRSHDRKYGRSDRK